MKKGLLIAAGVIAFIGLLFYLTIPRNHVRVEVCMSYEGRTACRTASGETEKAAINTATVNACALISSGMTESMQCQSGAPVRVTNLGAR